MGFNCGIVGLPNVGKSDPLQRADRDRGGRGGELPVLHASSRISGRVAVPDERLAVCARLAKSAKIIPTQLEFVDIAGLVRGASQGPGARQPVPRPYPRGRRDRACPALLRGRQRRACRGLGRPDPRRRDGRDRADAGRSRQPRTPRRRGAEARPRRRARSQSSSSKSSSRRSPRCATAGRRASPTSRPIGGAS